MVEKPYLWADGATLEVHSQKKHKVIREYFGEYLRIRCQLPQRKKFRLVVVDGFAGGGRYKCGSPGSPLIFIEELRSAFDAINLSRITQNIPPLEMECLFIFNDFNRDAINSLKEQCTPLLAHTKEVAHGLRIEVIYLNKKFEQAYFSIKEKIKQHRCANVIFNLDQCGHSKVYLATIRDIMASNRSAEVFYTFAVQALISFLNRKNPDALKKQLQYIEVNPRDSNFFESLVSKGVWLASAERLVFETLRGSAEFVSPFSIHNPDGWRYWLIHFANYYRARQAYNNVLHRNSSSQAHFGRSGLNMLAYNPIDERGSLYLFDTGGRAKAEEELLHDIPHIISQRGNALVVKDFYAGIYNTTPAHADDINSAIIKNPDLQVITSTGGDRQKANTIDINDTITLRKQQSFFQLLFKPGDTT